jgi:hypothetical protein
VSQCVQPLVPAITATAASSNVNRAIPVSFPCSGGPSHEDDRHGPSRAQRSRSARSITPTCLLTFIGQDPSPR